MKYIEPDWPAPACIKAYTTVKQFDHNAENLKTLLRLPDDPIWITQKHTALALEATPENKDKIADASFTAVPNRVCAVMTADCLPLLICNKDGSKVAAIHAGWRGLANGVVEATLQAMGKPLSDLLVWLGPAIGPLKFEVGEDVFTAFTERMPETEASFTAYKEGKWLADLYGIAKVKLGLLGVAQIYGGEFCTYTQEALFFSYRRDKGKTGRMISLIWIAPDDKEIRCGFSN